MTERPIILLDIETRAQQELLDNEDHWIQRKIELEPPANFKNPLVIEAWKTEAIAKERASMALRAHTGRIAALGACGLDSDLMPFHAAALEVSEREEVKLLTELYAWMRALDFANPMFVIAGWNIREFDLPFLAGRALALSLPLPWRLPKPRDWARVLDGYDVLGGHGMGGTLSDWMRVCGLPPKTADGADTLSLTLPELGQHCCDDLVATRVVLRRLVASYPGLVGGER